MWESQGRGHRWAQECVLLHLAVFLGNPRKAFVLNGRPVGTRTPDLYRVKAGTSSTYNNFQGCWGLPST
jgi:hypothetical protein